MVEGLTKIWPEFGGLREISFSVQSSSIGVVGNNGAGKSTLFELMSGSVKPSAGSFSFFRDGVRIEEPQVGYLPQTFEFDPWVKVDEFVHYAAWLAGQSKTERNATASNVLSLTGLLEHSHSRLGKLSGGTLRRAGIAAVLAGKPDCLLLDEPTAGFDAPQRRALRQIIREQSRHRIVLTSSHLIDDVLLACDEVVVLKAGFLEAVMTVTEETEPDLRQMLENTAS